MKTPEIKRLEEKLTKEVLWIYILSILAKSQSHPYVLRKKIQENFGFLPGNVTSYVVLYKLETRGYVSSKGVQNKRVYSITARGKSLLKQAKELLNEKQKTIFS